MAGEGSEQPTESKEGRSKESLGGGTWIQHQACSPSTSFLFPHHLRVAIGLIALQQAKLAPQVRDQPYAKRRRTPACTQEVSAGDLKGEPMGPEWSPWNIHYNSL